MHVLEESRTLRMLDETVSRTDESPEWRSGIGIAKSDSVRFVRSRLNEELRAKFKELADEWHRDTDASSSIQRKISHPAYLKIIKMDKAAVPFILEELETRPGHWFIALNIITEADPVPREHYGDMQKVIADWLEYLRSQKSYI